MAWTRKPFGDAPALALIPVCPDRKQELVELANAETIRVWKEDRKLWPNQGQELSQKAPVEVVYDITFTGTIRCFRWRTPIKGDREKIALGRIDALCYRRADGSVLLHDWIRINDAPIQESQLVDKNGFQDPFGLKMDRDRYIYRLRLTGVGFPLLIACEIWEQEQGTLYDHDGTDLAVSVLAWIPSQGRQGFLPAVRKPKEQPTLQPNPTEAALRADEERARTFQKRLVAIARREQEALEEIERMKVSEENKEGYRLVARNFAAGEIDRLSRGQFTEGAMNAETI